MIKHKTCFFLVFILIFRLNIIAQSIDSSKYTSNNLMAIELFKHQNMYNGESINILKYISYNMKDVQKINIYRWYSSDNDSILINEGTILDSLAKKSKNIEEIAKLNEIIQFDSLGRLASYKSNPINIHSLFWWDFDISYLYPDDEKVCTVENHYPVISSPSFYLTVLNSDSITYHYYENSGALKVIDAYSHANYRHVIIKFIYSSFKNCSFIVLSLLDNKYCYLDFFEFIYNDKKK